MERKATQQGDRGSDANMVASSPEALREYAAALRREPLSSYAQTKGRLLAVQVLDRLMLRHEDGGAYTSLWHARQHLLRTMPEYIGCESDRYWISRSLEGGIQ